MLISTRGRYALRVMVDLAEQNTEGYTAMKEVAARQQISLKYLERILPSLAKNGLIEGVTGKGGGYRLTKAPAEYRVGDILRLTEGELVPVACMECGAEPCGREKICRTRDLWHGFHQVMNDYFDNVTLADLMRKEL